MTYTQPTRATGASRLRRRHVWTAGLMAVGCLVVMAVFAIRIPASVSYHSAVIQARTPADKQAATYTARTELGAAYKLTKAQAAGLAPGAVLCLQVQTDRFTGRVTTRVAPNATPCTPHDTNVTAD